MGQYIEKSKLGLNDAKTYVESSFHRFGGISKLVHQIPDEDGGVMVLGGATMECDGNGWLVTGSGTNVDNLIKALSVWLENHSETLPDHQPSQKAKITQSPNIFS